MHRGSSNCLVTLIGATQDLTLCRNMESLCLGVADEESSRTQAANRRKSIIKIRYSTFETMPLNTCWSPYSLIVPTTAKVCFVCFVCFVLNTSIVEIAVFLNMTQCGSCKNLRSYNLSRNMDTCDLTFSYHCT